MPGFFGTIWDMKIHDINNSKGKFFEILETTERSQVAVMTIAPGGDSGAHGVHEGDQVVYCIAGEGEIEVASERTRFAAGQTFIIPAQTKHKAYNVGKKIFSS